LEVSNLVSFKDIDLKTFDFSNIRIDLLLQLVKRDILILENFKNLVEGAGSFSVSGTFSWDVDKDVQEQFYKFKELMDEREKTDLIVILANRSPLIENIRKESMNFMLKAQEKIRSEKFLAFLDDKITDVDKLIISQVNTLEDLIRERERYLI
jgi:hypothetical protein